MAISTSTWNVFNEIGLNQSITAHQTTQAHPLLHRVKCRDTSSNDRGDGEFVYLKGVASTVAGDVVNFKSDGTTARLVARAIGPVAVAMAATVAGEYGWYQVYGRGIATAGTVVADTQAYATATPGSIDDAVVTGDLIYGMRIDGATSSGQCLVALSNPYVGDTDAA